MLIKKRESAAQQQDARKNPPGANAGLKVEDGAEEQKQQIQYTGYNDQALIAGLDADMQEQISAKKRRLIN